MGYALLWWLFLPLLVWGDGLVSPVRERMTAFNRGRALSSRDVSCAETACLPVRREMHPDSQLLRRCKGPTHCERACPHPEWKVKADLAPSYL